MSVAAPDRPALERPDAAPVIGVLMLAVYGALLGFAASGGLTLRDLGGGDFADESLLSAELQGWVAIAHAALSVAVAFSLLRSDALGAALFSATAVLSLSLSVVLWAVKSDILLDAGLSVAAVAALVMSRGRPSGPAPDLGVTALAALLFAAAGVILGLAIALAAAWPGSELDLIATFGAPLGAAAALWVGGAAAFRFRWIRASLGWPLIGAGLFAGWVGATILEGRTNPAAAYGLETFFLGGSTRPDLAFVSAALLLIIGVLLLRAQARAEAAARVETLETTFR
ncbi:MAG: hypothetical protein AAGM38_11930 [Pseudomonadota bacterium]